MPYNLYTYQLQKLFIYSQFGVRVMVFVLLFLFLENLFFFLVNLEQKLMKNIVIVVQTCKQCTPVSIFNIPFFTV